MKMIRSLLSVIDARDVAFLLGLAALIVGLALVFVPAAFVIPGALLIWVALPHPRAKGGA